MCRQHLTFACEVPTSQGKRQVEAEVFVLEDLTHLLCVHLEGPSLCAALAAQVFASICKASPFDVSSSFSQYWQRSLFSPGAG